MLYFSLQNALPTEEKYPRRTVQYLVMLQCHVSWQVQHLLMLEHHFSWQVQYLVKFG